MPGTTESFVSLDIWTVIFAWGNIIILFLFLKKILFVPLKNAMDARQKEIGDLYDGARRDREAAAEMRDEYSAKLEQAASQGDEIIKSAVKRAQLQGEQILADARDSAEKTLKRAEEQIELERSKALNDIKDEVSGMAVDIASAVIERNLSEEENSAMIDQFIRELGEKK
ncbi:MAG: F0F1 ATP synthase subunit B [Clostridia bacterium]|nr:F0F1 ATP synthase subunit B [Clostridia bacterium]